MKSTRARWIACLLACAIGVSLTACGKSQDGSSKDKNNDSSSAAAGDSSNEKAEDSLSSEDLAKMQKQDMTFEYALDGDDRTGTSTDGENLRINGNMISQIRRVLVYTFIYEGAANWRDANGIVTVKCPRNQDIIVRMDEYGSSQTMCAIALFENRTGESFEIEKVVRFFNGHQDMDRAFNWGLRWVAGHK